jgi:Putative adhesin
MSDLDISTKEQVQPISEESAAGTEERPPDERAQPATQPAPDERIRPTTPPPFIPYAQSPYTWPVYANGVDQQWSRGRPYAPPTSTRRRSNWPWIVLIVVLLVVFVSGGAWFVASSLGYTFGSTSTTTQHYTVGANPTIVLDNDTGSIYVRAGASSSDVTIQATRHTGWWGNASDVNVTYAQDTASNTVTVNVERPGNGSAFGSSSVDFDLTVPAAAMLQLKTNTGSIEVSGVSGQLALTSNTGSVQASGGALSGDSQLLTNTGSVTFTGAISETGSYLFQTNTGSVDVTVPGTSVFHVDASTDTGSINTDFPGVVVVHRQFTGADVHSDVGSAPQATITLRTNTGSINLYQR